MSTHRQLIIVIIFCVALVTLATWQKMNERGVDPSLDAFVESIPAVIDDALTPDESFFEPEEATVDGEIASFSPADDGKASPERVTARAYLVGNVHTGEVYIHHNSYKALPVASMSKLVTAFVATDVLSATSTIEVTEDTVMAPPDSSNLLAGEKYELEEILLPLLLNSSNVAAESIASSTEDRMTFMELMSSYAWEIGMPDAYFADPSGVSPQNVASARGLFALAKYLVNSRQDILAITRIPSLFSATTTDHGSHSFVSTHPFVRDSRFVGGKTGRTPEAGETMMTILDLDEQVVVFIVLGSKYGYREKDTRMLIEDLQEILNKQAE